MGACIFLQFITLWRAHGGCHGYVSASRREFGAGASCPWFITKTDGCEGILSGRRRAATHGKNPHNQHPSSRAHAVCPDGRPTVKPISAVSSPIRRCETYPVCRYWYKIRTQWKLIGGPCQVMTKINGGTDAGVRAQMLPISPYHTCITTHSRITTLLPLSLIILECYACLRAR